MSAPKSVRAERARSTGGSYNFVHSNKRRLEGLQETKVGCDADVLVQVLKVENNEQLAGRQEAGANGPHPPPAAKREEIGSASIVGPVGYELRSGSGVGAGG